VITGRPASRPALAAAVLLAAAALAGCHPRLPALPPPADLPADPADLLAAVRAAQDAARGVEGRARVGVDAPGGGGAVDQFLAAEKPGRVRVESYDFFGNVLSVLVIDDGRLAVYDAREKVFYRGPATRENVGRLVPVALSPEELATLLCGSAPLLDGQPVSAEPGNGVMVLTLRRGDLTQVLEVGAGAAVVSSRLRRAGASGPVAVGLEADFSRHRPHAGLSLPSDLQARAPASKVSLSLHWKALAVNGTLDPALFRLDPPKGARVVDLAGDAP